MASRYLNQGVFSFEIFKKIFFGVGNKIILSLPKIRNWL